MLASPSVAALESRVVAAYSATPSASRSTVSNPTYQAVRRVVRLKRRQPRLVIAQCVTGAAHVTDQALGATVTQLVAQVPDVDLDDVVVAAEVVAPDAFDDLLLGE